MCIKVDWLFLCVRVNVKARMGNMKSNVCRELSGVVLFWIMMAVNGRAEPCLNERANSQYTNILYIYILACMYIHKYPHIHTYIHTPANKHYKILNTLHCMCYGWWWYKFCENDLHVPHANLLLSKSLLYYLPFAPKTSFAQI